MIVIVGCSAAKRDGPNYAGEMYTGQHYIACMTAACTLIPAARAHDSLRILSARYGLLSTTTLIEPYDVTLGQAGAVDADFIWLQARTQNLHTRPAMVLAGRPYAELITAVWDAPVCTPLGGLGIGEQRHVLAQIRDRRWTPPDPRFGYGGGR